MEETVVTPTEDPRIAALTRELDESRQSEKYWAGLARAGSASAAEPEPEPTEEESNAEFYDEVPAGLPDDTPEKMIDDFAAEVRAPANRHTLGILRALIQSISAITNNALRNSVTWVSKQI